jgi:hypothetical protein
MKRRVARFCAMVCLATFGLASSASAELIYGIENDTSVVNLVTWDSASPETVGGGAVTGLAAGEAILGIDFRPLTGQLYALARSSSLGDNGRLYTIDPVTRVATAVGPQFATPILGIRFGFDFNPSIDLIRAVSESDTNYVLNPITGAIQATATPLFYGPADPNFGQNPNVVDSAYSNNVPNAGSTQLYGIDTRLDILVTQANSAGTLGTVGPLGTNFSATGGFDISGTSGIAYAALQTSSSAVSGFYTINLLTGAATLVGEIDGGIVISAMTAAPVVPEPATFGLAACAVIGGMAFGRRRA